MDDLTQVGRSSPKRDLFSSKGVVKRRVTKRQEALANQQHVNQRLASQQMAEISDLKADLKVARSRYETLYNNAPVSYITLDKNWVIQKANHTFFNSLSLSKADIVGKSFTQLLADDDIPQVLMRLNSWLFYQDDNTLELKISGNNSNCMYVRVKGRKLSDEDGSLSLLLAMTNISELKEIEEQTRYHASYDKVTELYNRSVFEIQLHQAMAHAHRHSFNGAVMFFDLDRFKIINETLGHEFGDLLLRKVSQRIQRVVREEDVLARIGGDEFALLIATESSSEYELKRTCSNVAKKVIKAFKNEFHLGAHHINVSSSIGIEVFGSSELTMSDIFKHADIALYKAKNKGGNQFCFFSQSMQTELQVHRSIEDGLRLAMQNDELAIFFQPQVCTLSGKVLAYEALLRWPRSEKLNTPTEKYIQIAEECGFIQELGVWVLNQSLSRFQSWLKEEVVSPLVTLAINISPSQLTAASFVEMIRSALKKYSIPAHRLTLEITENIFLDDFDHTVEILCQLKKLGVQLSIDDFGTGFSSLSYLNRLPIDELKIDRSFVAEIGKVGATGDIISTIAALAKSLNVRCIVEGVENKEQKEFLDRLDSLYAYQGYLFGRPGNRPEKSKFSEIKAGRILN